MTSRARRPRLRLRLSGFAAAGCLAVAAGPALAAAPTAPQDRGQSPLAFASSKVSSLKGAHDAGGCLLTLTGQVPAGATDFGAALSRIDPATCTATVTSGPLAAVRMNPADTDQPADSTVQGASANSRKRAFATALLHRNGDLKAWAEDVVGLDVNNVHARVSYDYNGTRNWNALGSGCNGSWWWLSNTGWFRSAYNYFCQYEDSYTRVHSSTYGAYQNNSFCATFNVTNAYARANLWGNGNGSLSYTVGWQVNTGNCPLPINGAYVTVSSS